MDIRPDIRDFNPAPQILFSSMKCLIRSTFSGLTDWITPHTLFSSKNAWFRSSFSGLALCSVHQRSYWNCWRAEYLEDGCVDLRCSTAMNPTVPVNSYSSHYHHFVSALSFISFCSWTEDRHPYKKISCSICSLVVVVVGTNEGPGNKGRQNIKLIIEVLKTNVH